MESQTIRFRAKVLRKQDDLPRYLVVKPEFVAGRAGGFPATVTLNGGPPFARTVRPWGKGSESYFFNLTAEQCRRSGVDTGDLCEVVVVPK